MSPEKLEQAVRQFQRTGGRGLNITVPHKRAVSSLCDQLSERASTAGAVNTLVFQDSGIFGDNTDGIGLLRDLAVNLGVNLEGANMLILGAGGATRGIAGPLLEMLPGKLVIANRTIEKAQELVERFKSMGPISACSFNMVPVTEPYDLIINATSAGLRRQSAAVPRSRHFREHVLLRPFIWPATDAVQRMGARPRRRPICDGLGHAGGTGGRIISSVARRAARYGAGAAADVDQRIVTNSSELVG